MVVGDKILTCFSISFALHCVGVKPVRSRALRLYEQAARQGRASAEMKVGDFHYYGKVCGSPYAGGRARIGRDDAFRAC